MTWSAFHSCCLTSSYVHNCDGHNLFARTAGFMFLTCCVTAPHHKMSPFDSKAVCFLQLNLHFSWSTSVKYWNSRQQQRSLYPWFFLTPLGRMLMVLCMTTRNPGYFYENIEMIWVKFDLHWIRVIWSFCGIVFHVRSSYIVRRPFQWFVSYVGCPWATVSHALPYKHILPILCLLCVEKCVLQHLLESSQLRAL